MPALALAAIRQAATDEQLVRWAPECFGTHEDIKLAALAVTEPSGGSDVRSIQTRARKDGEEWVIDGQKAFIGNGGIADVVVVVATVDPTGCACAWGRPRSAGWSRSSNTNGVGTSRGTT
jgi:acyl-CoA dehydrogenase